MIGNPLMLGSADYQITRSLRFRSSASAYLNRTFAGSPTTFTWSCWLKRGTLSATQVIAASGFSGGARAYISFSSNDTLYVQLSNGTGIDSGVITTTAVYRDPSAWYHIVYQATNGGTGYLYVNNQQVGSAAISSGYWLFTSTATYVNAIGRYADSAALYFDGYMAEVNFIDGQALTPSSFGETDSVTGVWLPKKFTGTYGTNGFYLPFTDNSGATSTTIGKDYSVNGNNWTPNNISVTSGVTYDSMTDVPTLTGPTAANFAVLNPLTLDGNDVGSVTNGNLTITSPSTDSRGAQIAGSIAVSSGKFYWEETFTTLANASGYLCAGLQDATVRITGLSGSSRAGTGTWWISDDGNYRANGGSVTSSGLGAFSAGDVAMIAVDATNGKAWIGKNGTWVGDPAAGTSNTFSSLPALIAPFAQAIRNTTTSSVLNANFGQRPFAYTPPSGFVALNTFNLPTPAISAGNKHMNATLYTGNGSTQSIVNSGSMQPDLLWTKARSSNAYHYLQDSVRGVNKAIFSNGTDAEYSISPTTTTINSNGFSFNGGESGLNANTVTYVAWQWKANGAGSSNTSGSITSTVSANTTSGFSVVKWNGSGNATIGHGLGVAPSMYIVKLLDQTSQWYVYFSTLGTGSYVQLNLNAGVVTDLAIWQNTAPTSTVFSIGSGINANNMIAYCFAPIAGFSAFGSYTGNGSTDGPFIYTGFRPRWILIKVTSTTGSWTIVDTARDAYNLSTKGLYADLSDAEDTSRSVDILSNGFKFRSTANNVSGETFVYAAFAENPFKYSLAR